MKKSFSFLLFMLFFCTMFSCQKETIVKADKTTVHAVSAERRIAPCGFISLSQNECCVRFEVHPHPEEDGYYEVDMGNGVILTNENNDSNIFEYCYSSAYEGKLIVTYFQSDGSECGADSPFFSILEDCNSEDDCTIECNEEPAVAEQLEKLIQAQDALEEASNSIPSPTSLQLQQLQERVLMQNLLYDITLTLCQIRRGCITGDDICKEQMLRLKEEHVEPLIGVTSNNFVLRMMRRVREFNVICRTM